MRNFFTPYEQEAQNWISKMVISPSTGLSAKTTENILYILQNDPLIKGKIAFDEFANRVIINGTLPWDGVKRLDTLLTDYLGSKDTAYTRAVILKSLAAVVARAMDPGCKYDFIPSGLATMELKRAL